MAVIFVLSYLKFLAGETQGKNKCIRYLREKEIILTCEGLLCDIASGRFYIDCFV